jgi:excisionase family DNA binding protein
MEGYTGEERRLETLLRPDEVCEVLGISPATFYRLVIEGRLPALKIGSAWRVRPSALYSWIKEQSKIQEGL